MEAMHWVLMVCLFWLVTAIVQLAQGRSGVLLWITFVASAVGASLAVVNLLRGKRGEGESQR